MRLGPEPRNVADLRSNASMKSLITALHADEKEWWQAHEAWYQAWIECSSVLEQRTLADAQRYCGDRAWALKLIKNHLVRLTGFNPEGGE